MNPERTIYLVWMGNHADSELVGAYDDERDANNHRDAINADLPENHQDCAGVGEFTVNKATRYMGFLS